MFYMSNTCDTNTPSPGQLVRGVGAFTAACVLVSNMIGVGIFGTTGFMARDIGQPMLILGMWVLGGVYAFLGALCYSELGAAMPKAGGEYIYIRRAYGTLPGFLSGWTSFTIGFSAAIASGAHLFAQHLQQLAAAPSLSNASKMSILLDGRILGLIMIWTLTAVHLFGVQAGGWLQRLLTLAKVGAILLLISLGFSMGNGEWTHLQQDAPSPYPDFGILLTSFLFVIFSYSGWNAAGYIAGEIRNPGRNIPRATIWGTIGVLLLYLVLNLVYFYALSPAQLAADPIEPVAQKSAVAMFGPAAAQWINILLCISILGAVSAMIWAGPRVYYAMADDKVFPAIFSKTSPRSGAPTHSILLQSGWASVLVLTGGFETLVLYAGFVLIVFTALSVGAVIVLRWKEAELQRPYQAKGYPLVPAAYLLLSLAIMWAALATRPSESLLGIITVLAGIPFYFLWKNRVSEQ